MTYDTIFLYAYAYIFSTLVDTQKGFRTRALNDAFTFHILLFLYIWDAYSTSR